MHSCKNNLEKSSTEKKTKHTPSGYSLFTSCSFDATTKKLIVTKVKTVWNFLREFFRNARKNLVLMKTIKIHLNCTMKLDVIVITQENLEELLIVLEI